MGRKDCIREEIRIEIMKQMMERGEIDDSSLMEMIDEKVAYVAGQEYIRLKERKKLAQDVYNAIRKMDVLEEYLVDDEVTEIMVNGTKHIFIEKHGIVMNTKQSFTSSEKLYDIVQQIASKGNRIVNETLPILDVRLEDGSRVNIVLPPVALNGPVITIRKFPKEPLTMERLIECGTLTEQAADFLKNLVEARYNIFISGGTGSGKTTFLNILSGYIPKEERIITIEDSAELQIHNIDNLVRMEARNANVEGENQITLRDLVRSALRMRPDRIIVGEIRDAAAIEMLTAFNTGHDGSLSTGHANGPADMLNRMETLVLMGMNLPLMAVRQQIASALDIVIHLGRIRDKSRRVLEISEVGEVVDGTIQLRSLFHFRENGVHSGRVRGELLRTENSLQAVYKLQRAGLFRG